jgi:hypothetical protein
VTCAHRGCDDDHTANVHARANEAIAELRASQPTHKYSIQLRPSG